jgi:hypothetical protein
MPRLLDPHDEYYRRLSGRVSDSFQYSLAATNAICIAGEFTLSTLNCLSRPSAVRQAKTTCECRVGEVLAYFPAVISASTAAGKPLGKGTPDAA